MASKVEIEILINKECCCSEMKVKTKQDRIYIYFGVEPGSEVYSYAVDVTEMSKQEVQEEIDYYVTEMRGD